MTDSDALNAVARRWAEQRVLTMMDDWAGVWTLTPITENRNPGRETQARIEVLMDHSRHFHAQGKRKPSVSVSAPYLQSVTTRLGGIERAIGSIHDLAAELGLRVRIGLELDNVYEVGAPVLPLVWWNPKRLELEALEVTSVRRSR